MDIDPEVRKHALRSGEQVDTTKDRESRIARFESIRDTLNKKTGASDAGKVDGSPNGRPTPPEPAYRPVSPFADGDAYRGEGGARTSGDGFQYDSGPSRKNRREPGDIRASLSSKREARRELSGKSARPSGQDSRASGQEVSSPVDGLWESIKDKVRESLSLVGFNVNGDAEALTEDEALALMPKVSLAIQFAGGGVDLFFTHMNANHEECDIWTFEDQEATDLAVMWLKRAKRVRWMAQASRQVASIKDVQDLKRVGEIMGKRIAASVVFIPSNGGLKPWLR